MGKRSKIMRVIEIIADSSLSGAPRHLLTLAKLLQNNFEIEVICPDGWLKNQLKENKIKYTIVNFKSSQDLKAIKELEDILIDRSPDIIHFHGLRAGWAGIRASKSLKVKKIYSEHLYTEDYHLRNVFLEKLQIMGLKKIAHTVDVVIAPSKAVRDFLTVKLGIKSEKVKLVYNGLEDYIVTDNREKNCFGFIGSLNVQKGLSYLITSVISLIPKYPDLKFEIIGDGPLKKEVLNKIKNFKKNIKFLGQVDLISPYLSSWNFVVSPSLSESFGQVVLDAAIAKRPVVGTSVGGLKEIIEDGKTGLLVQKKDTIALMKAIEKLLKDPIYCQALGNTARRLYEKEFTADRMAEEFETLYSNL